VLQISGHIMTLQAVPSKPFLAVQDVGKTHMRICMFSQSPYKAAQNVSTGPFGYTAFKFAYIRLRMCAFMCALNSRLLGISIVSDHLGSAVHQVSTEAKLSGDSTLSKKHGGSDPGAVALIPKCV
jgi:hypothetical protein